VIRALVVTAALLGAAWLALEQHSARAADQLSRLAFSRTGAPTAAQVREARRLEPQASRWTPDVQPALDLGTVELRARDFKAAGGRFAGAAHAEPENVAAWFLLGLAASHYDSDLAATAAARVRELEPPVPPVR
jgi:hypothetical protein